MKNILSVFSNKNSDKTFSLVISNGNYDIIKKSFEIPSTIPSIIWHVSIVDGIIDGISVGKLKWI
jgi:hypothetical protein